MSRTLLPLALTLAATLLPVAQADYHALPATEAAAALPAKGDSQQAVLSRHGEPRTRHAPVGGDSPAHPPITRWDYPGFSVFFEHSHVVDAVIPDAPAPLFNTDELSASGG